MEILFDTNNRHHKREEYVKKHFPLLYDDINEYQPNNNPFIQKLYNFLNKIKENPKCSHCGINEVSFINFNKGYLKYCSVKCSTNNIETRNKTKITNNKKYGVSCVLKNNSIKDRIKNTNINKYGVDNPSKNINIINKIKGIKKNRELINWSVKLNKPDIFIKYLDNDTLEVHNYCPTHNPFIIKRQTLYGRYHRQGLDNICPECIPINENISNIENDIRFFVENELNIRTEKIILNSKEIDIYLSDHKLGIEFNGLYYHSDKFKDKNYHLIKTELCEKEGIQLLHVFEDEWVNKKDIVKSIIKSKLGIIGEKIFARKCAIREISDNKTIKNFLETNHLQGFIGSNVKIGLFYDDDLVSLMTFGMKRVALGNRIGKNNEYEMFRFCNKLNTQVIGGASKLLKYFIKNYRPKLILTFADRRYSDGKLYQKLGFEPIGYTKPNYYYFNPNNTIKKFHRFGFRKNVLVEEGFDPNKTEHEIMLERGYLRIYDSGNIKFKLVFQ